MNILSPYFDKFSSYKVKVFGYGVASTEDGHIGYGAVTTFDLNCFIQIEGAKRYTPNPDSSRDETSSVFISSRTKLNSIEQDKYADVVSWNNQYWEVQSRLEDQIIMKKYEYFAKLMTDVPKEILDLESE